MAKPEKHPPEVDLRRWLRNFVIELVIYGALVVAYFYLVLRLLQSYLTDLFRTNLTLYAAAALILIVLQGVMLESLTSFLLNQIKLDRFD